MDSRDSAGNDRRAAVIGGGIGGLAIAILLAQSGRRVVVLEKNEQLGGRASRFDAQGYRFDMGPSWYLMPDVFEQFFDLVGEPVAEHLDLVKLDPSYRLFFKGSGRSIDIHSDLERDIPTLEAIEPGSGPKLREYLRRAAFQYDAAVNTLMYKNFSSITDFFDPEVAQAGRKLSVFSSMDRYVRRFFRTRELQQIMQYSLVFLGSSPYNTPALYNIMSHIDFTQGVHYPRGGISAIIDALERIGRKHGVEYRVNAPVAQIDVTRDLARAVLLEDGERIEVDEVVSNADIHHTESRLLPEAARSYSDRYWRTRTLAPSALLLYLGVDGRVPELAHHNLMFASDWKRTFGQIFDHPAWPDDPSVYVCAPSVTDPTVAPAGAENLFVTVPIAPRLEYTEEELEAYADGIVELIGREMRIPDLAARIRYRRVFAVKDFEERYNAFGGSALGLAHTLRQTALLRPDTRSRKVRNLYYVGAGTNPGIGMPVCLISAELAYKRMTGDRSAGPLRSVTPVAAGAPASQ